MHPQKAHELTDTSAPTLVAPAHGRRPVEVADTSAPTLLRGDDIAVAATAYATSGAAGTYSPPPSALRNTVLPRIEEGDGIGVRLVSETKARYEHVKPLGMGGMGEVLLVQDHDIARPVAVKRLLPEMNDPAILARF